MPSRSLIASSWSFSCFSSSSFSFFFFSRSTSSFRLSRTFFVSSLSLIYSSVLFYISLSILVRSPSDDGHTKPPLPDGVFFFLIFSSISLSCSRILSFASSCSLSCWIASSARRLFRYFASSASIPSCSKAASASYSFFFFSCYYFYRSLASSRIAFCLRAYLFSSRLYSPSSSSSFCLFNFSKASTSASIRSLSLADSASCFSRNACLLTSISVSYLSRSSSYLATTSNLYRSRSLRFSISCLSFSSASATSASLFYFFSSS